MWRVTRGTATVILFGQMPIPNNVDWLTPDVEAAFNASQEVWFENPDFDPRTVGAAIQKRIALGGPRLAESIQPADLERLRNVLTKAGRDPHALDSQLTWQAYPAISDLVDMVSGQHPASMPERILKLRAKSAGKPIRSEWASMNEIMEFSSQQTLQQQLQLIGRTLDEVRTPEDSRRRADAWARGDVSIATAANANLMSTYPELAALLVTERNRRWVSRVDDMLKRNRWTFVCIGLGHLVGATSIQAQLLNAGMKVVLF